MRHSPFFAPVWADVETAGIVETSEAMVNTASARHAIRRFVIWAKGFSPFPIADSLHCRSRNAMHLGKRNWRSVKWVLTRKETYGALLRAFRVLDEPFSVLRDELFSSSLHRESVSVRTPLGRTTIRLKSPVDMSTVMGVFCREDYRLDADARVVVDIGANIGVASLYFLTRSADTFVYAFEPVPQNIEAFLENTSGFRSRIELGQTAVGAASGTVSFGVEPTGKFGGMKSKSDARIEVPCVSINEVMERVLSKHGQVDCLKVDVEGSEADLLSAMDHRFWARIRSIYAEGSNSTRYMPANFRRTFRYNVEQLRRT
jgi:FkbM family methyltransferase